MAIILRLDRVMADRKINLKDLSEHNSLVTKMKLSKQKYESFVDIIPEGVIIIDNNSKKIKYTNKSLNYILEKYNLNCVNIYSLIENSTLNYCDLLFNMRFEHKKITNYLNEEIHFEFANMVLNINNKNIIIGVFRDITQNINNNIIKKKIEEETYIHKTKNDFLINLSHELKTPLASMREGTELLADQVVGPLTPEQKEVVSILDSSSRNLQKLIEQLLDYNRKQADSAVELENVELAPLVETVVSAHSLPARAKMMHTDVDLKATACLAEPMLLMSVLDNLYSNAVHYGAESGNIWIRSSLHGSMVYIDVMNTGTPIPEAEQTMIFEPFFQGSHQRKGAVKGSGLGLSIARDCIRRMRGKLYLVDDHAQNVCFRIELPLAAAKNH